MGLNPSKNVYDVRKIVVSNASPNPHISMYAPAAGIQHNVLRQQSFQAVLLHTSQDDMLNPINENYPLAIVSLVNKPMIAYQLEYLERFGITNILVTIERKYMHKIEKYLKNYYKSSCPDQLNLQLVVFQAEEESMTVLKQMHHLLNSDFIVMDGKVVSDIPLDQILNTHNLHNSALTVTIKEFDMTKQGKGAKLADAETSDIFGISSAPDYLIRQGAPEAMNYNRIVLKSSKQDA